MKSLLSIGIRNVTLHWRHSLASLLSITAAFFALNVFQGYMQDLSSLYYTSYRNRSMYGDLLIMDRQAESAEAKAEPEKFDIPAGEQKAIADFSANHATQIVAINRFLIARGSVTNGKVSTIFLAQGSDLLEGAKIRGKKWRWNTLYGEPLDLHPEGGFVLLGQRLGKTLACLPHPAVRAVASDGGYKAENRPFECASPSVQLSTMTASGQLNAIDVKVGGLADAGYLELDRRYIWMGLKDAQTLLNTDHVSLISVLLANIADVNRVKREFAAELGARFPHLMILQWKDHPRIGDLYNRSMDLLSIFRNFVLVVIISISGLSVLNTMTKSLSERTREIGTLMSFGFRPRHIRLIFLAESLFLCTLGVLIGGVASVAVMTVVNHIGIFYKAGVLSEPVPFRIELSLAVAVFSGVGLLILSAAATGLACQRVLSKRIIECLQHV